MTLALTGKVKGTRLRCNGMDLARLQSLAGVNELDFSFIGVCLRLTLKGTKEISFLSSVPMESKGAINESINDQHTVLDCGSL
jgi:hypothetical protein